LTLPFEVPIVCHMSAPAKIERRVLRRDGFRFELRPYSTGVEAELFAAAIASRESIERWMGWLHPGYELDDCKWWVESSIISWDVGSSFEFVIFDTVDGSAVGSCGLNAINRLDLVCNLGYWVNSEKRRLGAATQATQLIWQFGIEQAGLNRLEIVVARGNVASRRVAEKVGALYEGVLRDRLRVGERVFDAHMYACLRK
jgi:ribosomal-protein-serine acetyltransferase